MSASNRPRAESKIFNQTDIKAIRKILTSSFDEIESKIVAGRHADMDIPDEINKQYTLKIRQMVSLLRSVALHSFSQIDFDAYFEGFKLNELSQKYKNVQDNIVKAIFMDMVDRSDLSTSLVVIERWKRVMQISLNHHDYCTAELVSLALGYVSDDLNKLLPINVQEKLNETKMRLMHRHLVVDAMEDAYFNGHQIVPNLMDMQDKIEKYEAGQDMQAKVPNKSVKPEKVTKSEQTKNENFRRLIRVFRLMFKETKAKFLSESENQLVIEATKYLQKTSDAEDFFKYSNNPKVIRENEGLIRNKLKLLKTEKDIQDGEEQLNFYFKIKTTYLDGQQRVKHPSQKRIDACNKLFDILGMKTKSYAEKQAEIQALASSKDLVFDGQLLQMKNNILETLDKLKTYIALRDELVTILQIKKEPVKPQSEKSKKRNSDKMQRRSTLTTLKQSKTDKSLPKRKKSDAKSSVKEGNHDVVEKSMTSPVIEIKVHRLGHNPSASAAATPDPVEVTKPKLPPLQLPKHVEVVTPLNSPTSPHSGKSKGSPKKSSSVPDVSPRINSDHTRQRSTSSPIRLMPGRKISGKIQAALGNEPPNAVAKPVTPRGAFVLSMVSKYDQQPTTPRGALVTHGVFGQRNQAQTVAPNQAPNAIPQPGDEHIPKQ